MILPHRNIEHKDFHMVDNDAKTYLNKHDSKCLSHLAGQVVVQMYSVEWTQ